MGPNGMMRNSMGPNGPGMNMGGMPRTSGHPGMMQGPGNGMMPGMQGNMMGGGHPGMQHGMGNRPPPPEYGMSAQGQNMPYMMGQMGMGPGPGPGNNMRMPGPGRNTGMQQIPPSGPMMRHQNPLGDKMRMPNQMSNNMNMNPMMMGGMNMNPGMKQGMNNMNMIGGPGGMSGHPSMIGANGNSMSGPPGQGWQGQPNPGQGPPNMPNPTSMSQGQTLSSSSMNRQSPGVMPGPNSAGENPQMPPAMNPRLQNMSNMPPNIPIEGQRGSPGLAQGEGQGGPGMMARHNMRNGGPGPGSGPPNFQGNMPNQMNQQMSMSNVRMQMGGGMPGMGPGQRPMGPGMTPGQHVMPPGQQMPGMAGNNHGMSPGHPSQHQVPGGPGQQRMPVMSPNNHGMSPGHPSQHQVPGAPGQQRMPGPPAGGQQGQQQTMNMHAHSPLNTVPQSPHMV